MLCKNILRIAAMCCAFFAGWIAIASADGWKPHNVQQLNGVASATDIPARRQIVTESWNLSGAVPYLAYMPEKDQLILMFSGSPSLSCSDDRGETWTAPRRLHDNAAGLFVGLTYLGNGKLTANCGPTRWLSNDYGQTWTSIANPPASNGATWHEWDPLLVDKDPATGQVVRLMSFCSDNLQPDGHFQGYIRFSRDGGTTWADEIKVPQMYRVNEVAFIRAKNGEIVAACRTDNPDEYAKEIDHYGGLGVSISKDDGRTWSPLNMLYPWGRHHASMVLMPNGDIVMTYVVRKGYPDTPEGIPQFGIEAVVSRDNGATWDIEHRYVLDRWVGVWPSSDPKSWWPSCQATSSVLLPDGSILTTFGTGYRAKEVNGAPAPRDVGLILWRLQDSKTPASP